MLSRVAESLYWLGRYVERAENVARLLDVEFHALLDAPSASHEDAWRELLWVTGKEQLFLEHHDEIAAPAVTEFLLWHPANPDSVVACVSRARENARSVRERISTEMWERVNRLHIELQDADRRAVAATPHALFVRLRDSSHAFQGTTEATMPRGETYYFLRLGASFERADVTARVVRVKSTPPADPEADELMRLTTLLRSCSALEAFRRSEQSELELRRVVAYLLLEPSFPRSVLACLDAALAAVRAISPPGAAPDRTIGRLCAELAFYEIPADPPQLRPLLDRVLDDIARVTDELAHAYFTTREVDHTRFAQAQQQ